MTLKQISLLLFSASLCLNADAARVNKFGVDTEVCDPVLIYTGGLAKRPTWTKTNLMPQVVHTYSDGTQDWFYDAFIFNETNWWGKPLVNTVGAEPATQKEWTAYLDHIFSDNTDLTALDELIGEMKAVLGEPRLRHKVIISMCVPCMYHSYRTPDGGDTGFQWTKFNWGTVDGVDMDFSNPEHRVAAVKWYIDETIRRFNAKKFKNIDLAGFYSMEEDMNVRTSNGDLQARYNDYVHELGLHAYWIPYWGANVNANPEVPYWSEKYHFDMAYRQPNYFFYTSGGKLPEYKQLTDAIQNSKLYGLGLELEFETAETSNGLHEVSPTMHQRLIDYLDAFEEKGVWESSGVAHYGGSAGFINMANSTDATNHATMDRLADIVVKRQKAFAQAGVESAVADEAPRFAFAGIGEIFIPDRFADASVYSLAGAMLHKGAGLFRCPAGIYIVADGHGHTVKVAVK